MKDKANELCKKVLSGDSLAFEQFVKKHTKEIHQYCYRKLFNTTDAQEVTQQSFYKFFLYIKSIKNNCRSYLFSIAHNCCYDEIKQKYRMKNFSHFKNETDSPDEEKFHQLNQASPPVEKIISFNQFNNIIKSIIDKSFQEIDSTAVEDIKKNIRQKNIIDSEERLLIKFVLLEGKSISEAGRLIGLNAVEAHNKFKKIMKKLRKLIPEEFWIKKI